MGDAVDDGTTTALTANLKSAIATGLYGTAAGTGNAITVAFSPAISSVLPDGACVEVLTFANNSGATTLDIGSVQKL